MSAYLQGLAEALNPLAVARALERCTFYPWIVQVAYRERVAYPDGSTVTEFPRYRERIEVVQATLLDPPDELQFVPEGAEFLRADVFPATRFDDMTPLVRANYKRHYRAFLMWRKAHALGKPVAQLQPWTDYDPVLVDENCERWACPGVRYAGD